MMRAARGRDMRRAKVSRKAATRRRKTTRPRRAKPVEAALAALAHEIRTPLTGILALNELLATADLPERERRWADAAKSAAEHLAHLTTLIVDGVRAEARGLTLRLAPFRLRGFAEAVAAALSARADAAGLTAQVTVADDLPDAVVGDPVRLRAALENLIDNAVKFTERGSVALAVEAKPARKRYRLTFTVRDSGIGLSRAEIARLFKPFSQANAAIAQRYGGSGLGLAFVKRVAMAMGGDLILTSKPGQGSTFRLTVTVAAAAAAQSARAGGARPAKSLRVLCAEDNPYARVVLNTVLGEFGYRADFVGTGEAAVAAVQKGYDLVLMDLTLPGLDGIAAVRAIRALPNDVPIIGISGRTEPAHIAAALGAGMNGFLAKPVSPASLAQAISEIVA
jgi:CheY-like chemotaxis protein/nitrogen-specific signal transduction histidine kinase